MNTFITIGQNKEGLTPKSLVRADSVIAINMEASSGTGYDLNVFTENRCFYVYYNNKEDCVEEYNRILDILKFGY